MRRGKVDQVYLFVFVTICSKFTESFGQAKAFFATSGSLAPHLFEPHHNMASLAEKTGSLSPNTFSSI